MKEKKDDSKGMSEADAESLATEITLSIEYSIDGLQESMFNDLKPLWVASGEAGNEYFNLVQFTKPEDGTIFSVIREDYLTWLQEYGGNQITKINETTKLLTRDIIKQGLIDGIPTSAIADALVEHIVEYTEKRALTIAQTESHNSFMRGNFVSATSSGFKTKTWISASDASVRPSHQALNGKKIKIDEEFKSGLSYPGDSRAPAREVVRCRCVIFYE